MQATPSAPGPRRAIRIAGALALLVLAFVLAGVALTRVDAGFLRARMEAAAYHATGRRLTIAGPIHLILFPSPGFVASDVALANVDGASRPAMAHASEVQATLDLAALLSRRVIVRSLVLENPDILVERTADGRPNWVFTPPAPAARLHAAGEVLPAPHPSAHVKLTISSVDIDGGRLAWRNLPRLGQGLGSGDVAIDHLVAQQQGEASSFTLYLVGRHAGTPFSLSLAAGPPQALEAADAAHPFPLRASLTLAPAHGHADAPDQLGPDQLGIDGQFADPLHGRGFAGVVHAHLRALADLEGLLPLAHLPAADGVRLVARVAQREAGGWTLSALHAETATADAGRVLPGLALARLKVDAADATAPVVLALAGTLHGEAFTIDGHAVGNLLAWTHGASAAAPLDVAVALGRARAGLHGTIARDPDGATRIDAAETLDLPDPGAVAAEFGRPLDRHAAIVVDGRLAAKRAADGDLTATLAAARLLIGAAPMPPSRFELDRHPGGPLRIAAALGDARPWLTWNEDFSHQPPDFTAVFDGHLVPASLVAALLGTGGGISGPLDLAGNLHGTAPDGRIDPATLDGSFAATLVDGTISGGMLAPALRATHLPLGGGIERVRCAAAVGQVTAGLVQLASLSLDSRLLTIDGDGTVNLPTGALALHLRPVVRLGVAAASAPVLVGGTVAAPEASLAHDERGRVALSFGRGAPAGAACDANPDVAALPAPKAPKPADILRSLGLFR